MAVNEDHDPCLPRGYKPGMILINNLRGINWRCDEEYVYLGESGGWHLLVTTRTKFIVGIQDGAPLMSVGWYLRKEWPDMIGGIEPVQRNGRNSHEGPEVPVHGNNG